MSSSSNAVLRKLALRRKQKEEEDALKSQRRNTPRSAADALQMLAAVREAKDKTEQPILEIPQKAASNDGRLKPFEKSAPRSSSERRGSNKNRDSKEKMKGSKGKDSDSDSSHASDAPLSSSGVRLNERKNSGGRSQSARSLKPRSKTTDGLKKSLSPRITRREKSENIEDTTATTTTTTSRRSSVGSSDSSQSSANSDSAISVRQKMAATGKRLKSSNTVLRQVSPPPCLSFPLLPILPFPPPMNFSPFTLNSNLSWLRRRSRRRAAWQ